MKKIILFLIILMIPINIKAIETSASSAILMDMDSGRILYSKNIHNSRSVASISKIMTAIIAIENNDVNKEVTIGDEIAGAHGSGIYIKQDEKLTIKDLLYGLMLRSGNDAALALAHHTTKDVSKFVRLMNDKASELGMNDTVFNNPSGLDDGVDGNYSSSYDMAILTSYAMKNDIFKEITKTEKYKLTTNKNTYIWYNKNKLLKSYEYTTGGKTGYTKIAKRTLVTTASKDGTNLVVVTLNDGNDWQDHKNLFEYGFENYTSYKILKKGKFNVYEDDYYNKYQLYIKNDFNYTLLSNEKTSLLLKINLEKKRKIKEDDKVGTVDVYLGDKMVHTENIYVQKLKESKKKSFIDWIKSLW